MKGVKVVHTFKKKELIRVKELKLNKYVGCRRS